MLYLSLLFLGACTIVRTYKVADFASQLDKASAQVADASMKIEKDYQTKSDLVQKIKKSGADFSKPPYKAIEQKLGEMKSARASFDRVRGDFNQSHEKFRRTTAGKDVISSQEPGFEVLNQVRDELPELAPRLQTAVQGYQTQSNAFNGLIQSSSIVETDVSELRRQVLQAEKQLRKQTSQAQKGIAKASQQIRGMTNINQSAAQERLGQLSGILKQINSESGEAKTAVGKFKKEVGKKKKMIIGPHMESHTIIVTLKEKVAKINALSQQYNALVKAPLPALKK